MRDRFEEEMLKIKKKFESEKKPVAEKKMTRKEKAKSIAWKVQRKKANPVKSPARRREERAGSQNSSSEECVTPTNPVSDEHMLCRTPISPLSMIDMDPKHDVTSFNRTAAAGIMNQDNFDVNIGTMCHPDVNVICHPGETSVYVNNDRGDASSVVRTQMSPMKG